jgi:hypothetical protein
MSRFFDTSKKESSTKLNETTEAMATSAKADLSFLPVEQVLKCHGFRFETGYKDTQPD